jgi:hypothetical protein
MYTSVVLLALSGYLVEGAFIPERPAWLNDYGLATKVGQAKSKPLALFVGSGPSGWEKVSKNGKLGKTVKSLLETSYVCLYVDTSSPAGRKLAEALEITEPVGLVLSDSTASKQAFWHEGGLKPADLERFLRKYSDPALKATTTDTKASLEAPRYQPPPFRSFGGSGGRGC